MMIMHLQLLSRHLRATRKSAVRPCILHPSVARGIHSFRSTRFERTEQMTTNQEWMTERAGRVGEGCKMQGRPTHRDVTVNAPFCNTQTLCLRWMKGREN